MAWRLTDEEDGRMSKVEFELQFEDHGGGLETWVALRKEVTGPRRVLAQGFMMLTVSAGCLCDGNVRVDMDRHGPDKPCWHYLHLSDNRDAAISALTEEIDLGWNRYPRGGRQG